MAAVTIDDATRFVCMTTFTLRSDTLSSTVNEIRLAVERGAPKEKGFIGAVAMIGEEKKRLVVVSLWESGHDWSAAQYDQEIGRALSDVVEATTSYDVATFETISVVRGVL